MTYLSLTRCDVSESVRPAPCPDVTKQAGQDVRDSVGTEDADDAVKLHAQHCQRHVQHPLEHDPHAQVRQRRRAEQGADDDVAPGPEPTVDLDGDPPAQAASPMKPAMLLRSTSPRTSSSGSFISLA